VTQQERHYSDPPQKDSKTIAYEVVHIEPSVGQQILYKFGEKPYRQSHNKYQDFAPLEEIHQEERAGNKHKAVQQMVETQLKYEVVQG
jgi:hypothetical protein